MEGVSVIGLDRAKNFIQLCAMTEHGEIVEERRVRLLHTAHVRPYVGVQKNDRADARAIREASGRARPRSVPTKTRARQDPRVLLDCARAWWRSAPS